MSRMRTIYFHSFFLGMLLEGKKWTTIRNYSNNHIRVGDDLTFRTHGWDWPDGGTEIVGTAKCNRVDDIEIIDDSVIQRFYLNGEDITEREEVEELRASEAFEYVCDMSDFIRDVYGLPFRGVVIGWERLKGGKQYYDRDKERLEIWKREYSGLNKNERALRARSYYEENKEKMEEYREKNNGIIARWKKECDNLSQG